MTEATVTVQMCGWQLGTQLLPSNASQRPEPCVCVTDGGTTGLSFPQDLFHPDLQACTMAKEMRVWVVTCTYTGVGSPLPLPASSKWTRPSWTTT